MDNSFNILQMWVPHYSLKATMVLGNEFVLLSMAQFTELKKYGYGGNA